MKMTKDTSSAKQQIACDELAAREDVINIFIGIMRSQSTRIKEAVPNLLDGSVPLSTRKATLFREEGVTIVSILTAIGMMVSRIVLAIINSVKKTIPKPIPHPKPSPDPKPDPRPDPSPKPGIRDRMKYS